MAAITNKYEGDFEITLYGHTYPMKWNYRTYGEFKTKTGRDPNSLFVDIINELNVMNSIGVFDKSDEISSSEVMTRLAAIAEAEYAVWLFYLAAKEKDKAVTFEEIQEAVMMEGVVQNKLSPDGELVRTYPQLVLTFALKVFSIGVDEEDLEAKKPESLKPSFLGKLKHLFST